MDLINPSSAASMSQAVATPAPPLLDEQQLRQFQEMFSQAPWLYPGAQPCNSQWLDLSF